MVIAYILLLTSFILLSYYGVTSLLNKWEQAQKRKAENTASQFEEMFIFLKRPMLITLYIVIPLALGLLTYISSRNIWLIPVALIVGIAFPLVLVRFMDKRRKKLFISQLVDGLMIMNSCLRGGLTLVQSFEVLSEEMSAPMSQEISLLNREIKVGVTLEEALLRLADRMPSEEMLLISSAILVARETGGDLTKVFSRLVETIRDRLKLKELVTSLTLQSRLQAIIISLLGPVFFVVINKVNPGHFNIMWENDLGKIFLFIAIILQVLGIVLIIIFSKVEI